MQRLTENNCLTEKSRNLYSSISILYKDIDGSLVSCTTISVYVILSKNELPKERKRTPPPSLEAASLSCGCKGTAFLKTDKT